MRKVQTPVWAAAVLVAVAGWAAADEPGVAVVKPAAAEPAAEPPLKDFTPAGFADLVPPDDHAPHAPGHLAPLAPYGRGFFLNADYFLLNARTDDQGYAVRTAAGLALAGGVSELRYRVGSGFRTEFGYRPPDLGLDVSFAYGYFGATGHGTVGADAGQLVRPTLTRPGLLDAAMSADAAAELDSSTYDLLVGRRWAVDDRLAVRGFAGVRFATVRQEFRVSYDGLDARNAEVFTRSRFSGAGPLAGGEAVYAWPRGFHLYLRGSGGLLSGLNEEFRRETNDDGRTVYADVPAGYRTVVPVVNLGVGGGFQYRSLSVRGGYEVTHWFGLTDRARFTSDVAPGAFVPRQANLSLDGLFLSVGLTF